MNAKIRIILCIFMASLTALNDAASPPNCAPPTYTWALGNSSSNLEANQTYPHLPNGDVTYGPGPLGYPAMEFLATTNSFTDLRLEYKDTFWNDIFDYSVQMYVYVKNNTEGTLFHYRSDHLNMSSTHIVEFVGYLQNGDVVLDFKAYGTNTYQSNLLNEKWYHLILERDFSNTRTFLFIDQGALEEFYPNALADTPTMLPGILRIGGSLSGATPPLDGRVACVQVVPGREPFGCVDHDAYCIMSNDHLASDNVILQPTTYNLVNLDNCMRFAIFATNASFVQNDVIDVWSASSVVDCALLCTREAGCRVFAVMPSQQSFECTLGLHVNATSTFELSGSNIYTVI